MIEAGGGRLVEGNPYLCRDEIEYGGGGAGVRGNVKRAAIGDIAFDGDRTLWGG